MCCLFFFFKQKTAYEMRISDWSSDVCSSDLKPVMQRHGIEDLDALVAALVTSTGRQLLDDTVDAMLNNETFFYREHSVFDDIAVRALDHVRETNGLTRRVTI